MIIVRPYSWPIAIDDSHDEERHIAMPQFIGIMNGHGRIDQHVETHKDEIKEIQLAPTDTHQLVISMHASKRRIMTWSYTTQESGKTVSINRQLVRIARHFPSMTEEERVIIKLQYNIDIAPLEFTTDGYLTPESVIAYRKKALQQCKEFIKQDEIEGLHNSYHEYIQLWIDQCEEKAL